MQRTEAKNFVFNLNIPGIKSKEIPVTEYISHHMSQKKDHA